MIIESQFRKHLLHLIYGTKGGLTRIRIIELLFKRPYNANQITKELSLDYKTIQHHIRVMLENNIITSSKKKYGNVYFASHLLKQNKDLFKDALKDLGKYK